MERLKHVLLHVGDVNNISFYFSCGIITNNPNTKRIMWIEVSYVVYLSGIELNHMGCGIHWNISWFYQGNSNT